MNRNSSLSTVHGHRQAVTLKNRSQLHPKRELMICLGWLRLFQAITAKNARND